MTSGQRLKETRKNFRFKQNKRAAIKQLFLFVNEQDSFGMDGYVRIHERGICSLLLYINAV